MLNCNEGGEEDIFYDTVDYISECMLLEEESVSGRVGLLDYGIWRNNPRSVSERRERFLQGMGFGALVESDLELSQEIDEGLSEMSLGLERMSECSGAVSCSFGSLLNMGGEEDFVCGRRDPDDETKYLVEKLGGNGSDDERRTTESRYDHDGQETILGEVTGDDGQEHDRTRGKKKLKNWYRNIMNKKNMARGRTFESDIEMTKRKVWNMNRMKVQHNKKRYMECTAVYMGQEVHAHTGYIWTMKFSPDGQYLASGGEDGVIRIWRVTSTTAPCTYISSEGTSKLVSKVKDSKFFPGRKCSSSASVVIPKKVFKIEHTPIQEFHGHTSDVLDICWSNSNRLLSSSKDNTVRSWEVGSDKCLQTFNHSNYVTCIQFNPIDDRYFISGSIDGKVRIWGISESRVVDWADVRDIVTAICYQPNGQGFIVGCITGRCRFYGASGNNLQLDAQIRIHSRKKSFGNRITGFQFSPEDSQKVMITSADSRVRIFDGVDVIHKYKGLRRSGSQLSASFTSDGRHIVSVGEDSHVYVWNYDDIHVPTSKHSKSIRSCEHFFSEGVSVAIPWSGLDMKQVGLHSSPQAPEQFKVHSCERDSTERCSLGGWFSMDGLSRGSATWPEEKLPLWDIQVPDHDHHNQHHQQKPSNHTSNSATWGLVIVTAGWDGVIRAFHNYGLPVRL